MNSVEIKVEEENIVEIIGNVTSPFVVLSELIKNGVDANAKSVTVHIDTLKKTIKVVDNGDGFTLDDILNIANVASSNKKREAYWSAVNRMDTLNRENYAVSRYIRSY
jgi:HSP90 family molecular chaperone